MTDVIRAEASAYLTSALGDGAAGIAVAGIETTGAGPRVRWDIPRLSRPRVSLEGAPDRALVAELVSRMLALRWQGSQAPREVPAESYLELHEAYPEIYTIPTETSRGWHWLLSALAEWIRDEGVPAGFESRQVKEKFGTLRFYASRSNTVSHLLRTAEWVSGSVCDACGAPGSVRPGGWIRTACDEHARKR